jgi:CHAT domain-containing protein
MLSQKWLSKITLFFLTAIFTLICKSILIPVLLPQAEAQYIYPLQKVAQNNLNPQVLLETGKRLYHTEKFLEAISVLEQAAEIYRSQGNQFQQAVTLSNLSLAYKKIGKYQQALNYINQSRKLLSNQLNINESDKKVKIFAQVLDIQANLELKLGKAASALENWKQATAIYQQGNFKNQHIRSLINQSLALQALGRYQQANKILKELLPKLNPQPASVMKVAALQSFGDTQLYLGEINTSIKTLQQSYKIAQKIKSNSQIAKILLSLGNAQQTKATKATARLQKTINFAQITPLLYVDKPISPEVEKLFRQALQTYQQVIDLSTSPAIKAKAQCNLLNGLIQLKEFAKAAELSSQLQSTIDKLPVSDTSISARIKLAQNLLFLKQVSPDSTPESQNIAKILTVAIQQATALENKRTQSYAMGTLGSIYLQDENFTQAQQLTQKAVDLAAQIQAEDIAYLWQWQLGYIFKIQNNTTQAIDYYFQAVDNLNNLRGDLLVFNPDIQFSFRDNVEPVYRQLADLLLKSSSNENFDSQKLSKTNSKQTNLKNARDVIEALQLREIENYFQEVCLQAKPEIIDTVVDKTDTAAAVIYPIILQNRLEIILKLPNQNKFNRYTTFIRANQLEKAIEKLQYSLRQPEKINQVKKISGDIYNWLIQPLEADLQINQVETLVFVLDGNLKNIPMAVLYDGEKQKYLIEEYAIALTPGLQMLEPKPLPKRNLNILMAGVSEKRWVENKEFSPLDNVQLELNTIQSQIPNSKKLLNQSFTETNTEKLIDSAKYTVVHIASHGNFSSNLEETYILTWNKLLKLKDFDKLFQINTNVDAKPIELLVLSACETAKGDKRATLGLSGIAVRAGARSTLASLWAVEDESTALLMTQFYQELQQNQLNKAQALQKAQINLLRNNQTPFVWAPYLLVGNWL